MVIFTLNLAASVENLKNGIAGDHLHAKLMDHQ